MILISAALVLVAIALLILGVVMATPFLIMWSIVISVLSAVCLLIGALLRRHELFPAGGRAADEQALTPRGPSVPQLVHAGAPPLSGAFGGPFSGAPTHPVSTPMVAAPPVTHAGAMPPQPFVPQPFVPQPFVPQRLQPTAPLTRSPALAGRGLGPDAIVLVIPGRKRFHLANCRQLAGREVEELTHEEARDEGFTPCTTCLPEVSARTTAEPDEEAGRREGPRTEAGPTGTSAAAVPAPTKPTEPEWPRPAAARTELTERLSAGTASSESAEPQSAEPQSTEPEAAEAAEAPLDWFRRGSSSSTGSSSTTSSPEQAGPDSAPSEAAASEASEPQVTRSPWGSSGWEMSSWPTPEPGHGDTGADARTESTAADPEAAEPEAAKSDWFKPDRPTPATPPTEAVRSSSPAETEPETPERTKAEESDPQEARSAQESPSDSGTTRPETVSSAGSEAGKQDPAGRDTASDDDKVAPARERAANTEPVEPAETAEPGRAGFRVPAGSTSVSPPVQQAEDASDDDPDTGVSEQTDPADDVSDRTVEAARPTASNGMPPGSVKVMVGTRRFHSSECPLISGVDDSGVEIMTKADAEEAGLTHCSVCQAR